MKNIINYYYNLNAIDLRNIGNDYIFKADNKTYLFCRLDRDFHAKSFFQLMNELSKIKYFHTLIYNKDKIFYTFDGRNNYVLLRVNFNFNRYISIEDILRLNLYSNNLSLSKINNNFNWTRLWKEKIDYLEYYINTKDNINDKIKCIFYYFIGISENSIKYIEKAFESVNSKIEGNLSLTHKRINHKYTLYEFYNPLNVVVDHTVRDISEYLKSIFIDNIYSQKKIDDIIYKLNLSEFGYKLLYGRVAFPTFFFDLIDRYEEIKFDEKDIISVYDRAEEYEKFVLMVYLSIKNIKNVNILNISWIGK